MNFTPCFLHSLKRYSAPGDSFSTWSYTSCSTLSGNPANRPTRLRSDCSKSNSPRMDCSVIAATCSFSPTPAAISSTHSMVISVESMSLTISPRSENGMAGNTAWSIFSLSSSAAASGGRAKFSGTSKRRMLPFPFSDGLIGKGGRKDRSQRPMSGRCKTKWCGMGIFSSVGLGGCVFRRPLAAKGRLKNAAGLYVHVNPALGGVFVSR